MTRRVRVIAGAGAIALVALVAGGPAEGQRETGVRLTNGGREAVAERVSWCPTAVPHARTCGGLVKPPRRQLPYTSGAIRAELSRPAQAVLVALASAPRRRLVRRTYFEPARRTGDGRVWLLSPGLGRLHRQGTLVLEIVVIDDRGTAEHAVLLPMAGYLTPTG